MKRIIIFTVLIILIILFHLFGILAPVENIVLKIAAPVGNIFHRVFIFFEDNYQKFFSRKDFEEENKRLRERIKELVIERAEFNILREENTSLKKMFLFLEEKDYENIATRIIGKTAEGDINTIIIDKGEKDGIENNLPVIAESGIIIGKIIKTATLTSNVLLLSDGSSEVAGMVQNNNKTIGIVKGGYGLGIRMELIPQIEEIKSGEIVVTSGLELEIPKGLLIGVIESVIKEPRTAFQTVTIKPLLDYEKLDLVSVLKK